MGTSSREIRAPAHAEHATVHVDSKSNVCEQVQAVHFNRVTQRVKTSICGRKEDKCSIAMRKRKPTQTERTADSQVALTGFV